jgi:hypothetical protein
MTNLSLATALDDTFLIDGHMLDRCFNARSPRATITISFLYDRVEILDRFALSIFATSKARPSSLLVQGPDPILYLTAILGCPHKR